MKKTEEDRKMYRENDKNTENTKHTVKQPRHNEHNTKEITVR